MAAGYCCCLREQWLFFYILVFFATLNRESGLVLVCLIPTLYWHKKKQLAVPIIISTLLFLAAKIIVFISIAKIPGLMAAFYKLHTSSTLFLFNLQWLLRYENILLFIFCMAGLPFLWFSFYDYIPIQFRPVRYLVCMYFIGLLFVGVFPETRIFIELIVLMYLPVCVAVYQWITEGPLVVIEKTGIWYFIDRYVVLVVLVFIVLFQGALNQLISRA
jgi:hypothetical protein